MVTSWPSVALIKNSEQTNCIKNHQSKSLFCIHTVNDGKQAHEANGRMSGKQLKLLK